LGSHRYASAFGVLAIQNRERQFARKTWPTGEADPPTDCVGGCEGELRMVRVSSRCKMDHTVADSCRRLDRRSVAQRLEVNGIRVVAKRPEPSGFMTQGGRSGSLTTASSSTRVLVEKLLIEWVTWRRLLAIDRWQATTPASPIVWQRGRQFESHLDAGWVVENIAGGARIPAEDFRGSIRDGRSRACERPGSGIGDRRTIAIKDIAALERCCLSCDARTPDRKLSDARIRDGGCVCSAQRIRWSVSLIERAQRLLAINGPSFVAIDP